MYRYNRRRVIQRSNPQSHLVVSHTSATPAPRTLGARSSGALHGSRCSTVPAGGARRNRASRERSPSGLHTALELYQRSADLRQRQEVGQALSERSQGAVPWRTAASGSPQLQPRLRPRQDASCRATDCAGDGQLPRNRSHGRRARGLMQCCGHVQQSTTLQSPPLYENPASASPWRSMLRSSPRR
jgi:hypothetical protein